MPEATAFLDLVRRVRAGDDAAAAELVRRYEPLIRREVRLRLEDRRLGRLFDSMDVCQSVLKSFFVRTAAGQFDLDEPGQLIRLLVTMTRNKLASEARKQHRDKRDQRRQAADAAGLEAVAEPAASPSRVIEARDLLAEVRGRLADDERQLADLRAQGLTWDEVAARVGGTAHNRRVQLSRALDRVAEALQIDT
jgi:RNA polymerase sigma factor (sigma-70 family)